MKRESGLNPELYPQLYAIKLVVILLHHCPLGWEGSTTRRKPGDLPST